MRTISDAEINFITSAGTTSTTNTVSRAIQAASAEEMEEKFAALVAEMVDDSYVLAFVDLAGAGDGHTFVCMTEWALDVGGQVGVIGIPNDAGVNAIAAWGRFYLAAQADALSAAREAAQARLSTVFDVPNVVSVTQFLTIVAGAKQGTRVMGSMFGVGFGSPG